MIPVDAARRLGPRAGDLARLDHAVQAAVRLARVALSAGDAVGLIAFSAEISAALPPRKGTRQLAAIVDALASIEADGTEPDYGAAFAALRRQVRRRPLVVGF